MLEDARRGLVEKTLIADVCVIGSGPVGQAAASDLSERGATVIILEAGGRFPDTTAQHLATPDGPSKLDRYPDASTHRSIALGGTSARWTIPLAGEASVRLQHINPGVFAARPGRSGQWPINRVDLEPSYARAARTCGISDRAESPKAWPFDPDAEPLKFSDGIESHVVQLGRKARFHGDAEVLRDAGAVRTIINARATRLVASADGNSVVGVDGQTPDGQRFHCAAGSVVVALGGIGNATLLAASTDPHHPDGLGNHSDQLGRFFMDHPIVRFGYVELDDPADLASLGFYDRRTVAGASPWGTLGPTPERLAGGDMLDFQVTLMPAASAGEPGLRDRLARAHEGDRTGAVMALREAAVAAKARRRPANLAALAREFVRGADDVARYALMRLPQPPTSYRPWGYEHHGWSSDHQWQQDSKVLQLVALLEQAPHPENRVVLSERHDQQGQRRFRVDWRWSNEDRRLAVNAQALLLERMGDAGLGRVVATSPGEPQRIRATAHHHSGTTRMSADPAEGVVDPYCRIHGIDNAYVVGSSVFPSAGAANPTLTGIALAHRAVARIA